MKVFMQLVFQANRGKITSIFQYDTEQDKK